MNTLKNLTRTADGYAGKLLDFSSTLTEETKKATPIALINATQGHCIESHAACAKKIATVLKETDVTTTRILAENDRRQQCIANTAAKVFDMVNYFLADAYKKSSILRFNVHLPVDRINHKVNHEVLDLASAKDVFSRDVEHYGLVETIEDVKRYITSLGHDVVLTFTYLGIYKSSEKKYTFEKHEIKKNYNHIGYFGMQFSINNATSFPETITVMPALDQTETPKASEPVAKDGLDRSVVTIDDQKIVEETNQASTTVKAVSKGCELFSFGNTVLVDSPTASSSSIPTNHTNQYVIMRDQNLLKDLQQASGCRQVSTATRKLANGMLVPVTTVTLETFTGVISVPYDSEFTRGYFDALGEAKKQISLAVPTAIPVLSLPEGRIPLTTSDGIVVAIPLEEYAQGYAEGFAVMERRIAHIASFGK